MEILLSMLWNAIAFAAILAGFMYGVAPLLVRRSNRMGAEPQWLPTELDALEAMARQNVRRLIQELDGLGFVVKGNLTNIGLVAGSTTVRLLLVDQNDRCWIEAFDIVVRRASVVTEIWTIAIRTRFADGTCLVTASSPPATAYPANPSVNALNLFWIKDAPTLLAIHAKRLERSSHTAHEIAVPNLDEPSQFMLEEHRAEMKRLLTAGYYRVDPETNQYPITLKGAYLMTWRLLWPIKGIRRRARMRKAQRALRELGFADLATRRAIRDHAATSRMGPQ